MTLPLRRLLFAMLLLAFTVPAAAQSTNVAEANQRFQDGDWPGAAAAYADLAAASPEDGRLWYRLGFAHHQQGHYAEAIAAWTKAEALSFAPPYTRFNLAAAHARLGHPDDAFEWLGKSAEAGLNNVGQLESDEDLATLRDDARFAEVRQSVDRNANPCVYDDNRRAFDFWAGEWTVTSVQGQPLGENRVEKIERACVLQENWTSGNGGSGTSFNYYDPEIDAWKQLWVDATGNHADFTGHLRDDGAMHFEGQWTSPDGTTSLMKMTFTPQDDGRVRQYIEQSTDGGATYQTWFDGYYARKAGGM